MQIVDRLLAIDQARWCDRKKGCDLFARDLPKFGFPRHLPWSTEEGMTNGTAPTPPDGEGTAEAEAAEEKPSNGEAKVEAETAETNGDAKEETEKEDKEETEEKEEKDEKMEDA